MHVARVLAITPPGSMEKVVSDLRGELYRRWGAVSALALPPLVPIRPWTRELPRAQAASLLARAAAPLSLSLERYEREGGYLFLSVVGAGLEGVRRRLEESPGARVAGTDAPPPIELFPYHQGFLLAGPDLEVSADELERAFGIPSERRFGSYGLSVLCVRTHAPLERWWDLVSWEEEVHVPVKRSGRAAPGSGAGGAGRSGGAPTGVAGAPDPSSPEGSRGPPKA